MKVHIYSGGTILNARRDSSAMQIRILIKVSCLDIPARPQIIRKISWQTGRDQPRAGRFNVIRQAHLLYRNVAFIQSENAVAGAGVSVFRATNAAGVDEIHSVYRRDDRERACGRRQSRRLGRPLFHLPQIFADKHPSGSQRDIP